MHSTKEAKKFIHVVGDKILTQARDINPIFFEQFKNKILNLVKTDGTLSYKKI